MNSVVTFQNIGQEYGCVGNVGGSTATGSAQCFGGVTPPGGVTHEQTGSGNNTYTAATLGLTSSGTNSFANLILIFNGNEGGGSDAPITLEKLSLNLFTSTGTFLEAFSTPSAIEFLALTGVGNAGFGFQLDAAQSAQANALLAANPDLVIGASAFASGANSGPETVFISRINSVQPPSGDPGDAAIPEPTTIFLMGSGLVAVALLRSKRR